MRFQISYKSSRFSEISQSFDCDFGGSSSKVSEMEKIQILGTPIKSESDVKEYRLLKLPNGLKVFLITSSDNDSNGEDIAAATMTVKVGSFNDPPNALGLAHFLEHMLFMGSEKYPVENGYDQFLKSNGGSSNASTDAEHTTYFFKVTETAFAEALDMFAYQFISPLLRKEAMQREREAVDSEFQMAKTNDYVLSLEIIKTLIFDHHPASQFNYGNLKTLKEKIGDDDLHRELLKLSEAYVANRMNLCIQSKRSLDELQELVVKSFSAIKRGPEEVNATAPPIEKIFKSDFFTKLYYMKPKTTRKSLMLTWALPSHQPHYKSWPLDYIQEIFHNVGDGSIASYLINKQLITDIGFSFEKNGFLGNSQFVLPMLTLKLTDQGMENIERVLETIFSYLLVLKETPIEEHRRLYLEKKAKKELEFKFQKEYSAVGTVRSCVTPLMLYEDADILRGSFLLQVFDEKLILDTINAMNERKFHILIMDSDHETYNKKGKYFGVDYEEIDFPEAYQQLWNERKLNPEFYIEKPNPFRVTNFEIYVNEEESPVSVLNAF